MQYFFWQLTECFGSNDGNNFRNNGPSESCLNYEGSSYAISVFQVADSPMNFIYPFEGTRTAIDSEEFCISKGGPGTTFGLDDKGILTEG